MSTPSVFVRSLSVRGVSAVGAPSLEKRSVSKCFVGCVLFAAHLTTHKSSISFHATVIQYNNNSAIYYSV